MHFGAKLATIAINIVQTVKKSRSHVNEVADIVRFPRFVLPRPPVRSIAASDLAASTLQQNVCILQLIQEKLSRSVFFIKGASLTR